MIKDLIILAAGSGSKIWPYSEIRNKTMIPIANKPILAFNVETALELGVNKITIVTGKFSNGINHYFASYEKVECITANSTSGSVDSLLAAEEKISNLSSFAVLYGDTIIQKNDLKELLNSKQNSILVSTLREATGNVIGTNIENGKISGILGHPREDITHRFAGFHLANNTLPYLKNTPDFMHDLQVGMMPVQERYIESTVADMIRANHEFSAIETKEVFYDIDKPWHILEANTGITELLCSKLTKNELAEDTTIDSTADLRGFVKLGKGSKIGRNVIIEGNIIVGDNTIIDNGAIINSNVIIDNNVYIGNYCFISSGSSIGSECFLGHASEFWGLLMNRIYLYHYMEMFGIIGENTDIGAGTVCGTLRFDDGNPTHNVKGKKEIPYCNSEAIYLGDYSRTGVNAIILPGVKTGVYSLVGPGVVLNKDLPNRKAVFVKQEQEIKDWGPEKYGW